MKEYQSTYQEQEYSKDPIQKTHWWNTAFQLQTIDRLQPSEYIHTLAQQHIQNEIGYNEIYQSLGQYYTDLEKNPKKAKEIQQTRVKEADTVSTRIVELLDQGQFELKPSVLNAIHHYLFQDVLPEYMTPGEYRTTNISKKEDMLQGESVAYSPFFQIGDSIAYDFKEEMAKDYSKMTKEETLHSVQSFISGLWQIHPFREGNTRTMAVFTELYLQSKGFKINNLPFEKNAQYFRDALVLANVSSIIATPNPKPLTAFFEALTDETNRLTGEFNLPPIEPIKQEDIHPMKDRTPTWIQASFYEDTDVQLSSPETPIDDGPEF